MTLEEFLARCKQPKRAGKGHVALCQAHDDDRHSLSIGVGADGKILVSCKAGCAAEDVVKAMSLGMKDLFPAESGNTSNAKRQPKVKAKPPPLTEDEVVAEQKALRNDPAAWAHATKTLNFTEEAISRACLGFYKGHLSYPCMKDGYEWTHRKLRSIRGDKRFFRDPTGQDSHLYTNASELTFLEGGTTIVFEGERDAVAATSIALGSILPGEEPVTVPEDILGAVPVSIPDGVESATKPCVIEPLKTQELVFVALDSDAPGDRAAEAMADALGRERCRRVRFPGFKDLGDLLAAKGVEEARRIALEAFRAAAPMAVATARDQAQPTPTATEVSTSAATATTPALLSKLSTESTLAEVKLALEELAAKAMAATAPERALERERAVAALKPVKAVSSPAKLVDAFIGPPVQPDEEAGLSLHEVEPAAEPQATGELLAELVETFGCFVVLPPGAAVMLATWAMHTWVPEISHYTPRIVLSSPTKRCGKTVTLEVLEALCARATLSANLTAAVLYRAIEAFRPTLLVDEADTFLGDNEELRGVINAGYKASGTVLRCEGDDHQVTKFRCFAPVAIAAIGNVPATIADRAFTIKMSRKGKGEKVERLDRRARAALAALPPRLARWAEDNLGKLQSLTVDAPESLNDRQRELAEPPLMIAELAGGEWPARVRDAIVTLCGASDDATDRRERLLAAVWALYAPGVDFITTKVILEKLLADEESEWREASNGRPLSPVWLGRYLKSFGLKTSQPREAGQQRGYTRTALAPVVGKYLSDPGVPGEILVSPVSERYKQLKLQAICLDNATRVATISDTGRNLRKLNEFTGNTGDTHKTSHPAEVKVNGVLRPEDVWSPGEIESARRALAEEGA